MLGESTGAHQDGHRLLHELLRASTPQTETPPEHLPLAAPPSARAEALTDEHARHLVVEREWTGPVVLVLPGLLLSAAAAHLLECVVTGTALESAFDRAHERLRGLGGQELRVEGLDRSVVRDGDGAVEVRAHQQRLLNEPRIRRVAACVAHVDHVRHKQLQLTPRLSWSVLVELHERARLVGLRVVEVALEHLEHQVLDARVDAGPELGHEQRVEKRLPGALKGAPDMLVLVRTLLERVVLLNLEARDVHVILLQATRAQRSSGAGTVLEIVDGDHAVEVLHGPVALDALEPELVQLETQSRVQLAPELLLELVDGAGEALRLRAALVLVERVGARVLPGRPPQEDHHLAAPPGNAFREVLPRKVRVLDVDAVVHLDVHRIEVEPHHPQKDGDAQGAELVVVRPVPVEGDPADVVYLGLRHRSLRVVLANCRGLSCRQSCPMNARTYQEIKRLSR